MRVHGSQETITQLHRTSKGALTSTGYPTGLHLAEEKDDMAGILRESVGIIGLKIRRREMMVLKTLPRLGEFVVFDVQLRGRWTVYHQQESVNHQCVIGVEQREHVPDGFQITGTRPLDGRDGRRDHREAVQQTRVGGL